jgi:sulfonate transport system substrate-binding protein
VSVRVGVNAHDPMIYFLSRLGILERELGLIGETVEWRPYAPGLKAPEFLGADLDFVGCGQTPMLTAQAAGQSVVYVASSPNRPDQGALIVAADSPIASAADLVGRRIAFPVGAWTTQLVAVALDNAGLSLRDIEIVGEQLEDPLDALLTGRIDAWTALGPRLVEAEETNRVRRLVPTDSAVSNRALWTTLRDFAEHRTEVIAAIITAIELANHWLDSHRDEAARLRAADTEPQAAAWGGDARSWRATLDRMPWSVIPIDDDFIAEQQHAGDVLHACGFLPREIDTREAFIADLQPVVRAAVKRAAVAAAAV